MTDILIALGVKADETLGREESHANMMEGFKPSKYKFPMVLKRLPAMFKKQITVTSLGNMVAEPLDANNPKYHNEETIFPIGYTSSCYFDDYQNLDNNERIQYFNEILNSTTKDGPVFRVSVLDDENKFKTVALGKSPSMVWLKVFNMVQGLSSQKDINGDADSNPQAVGSIKSNKIKSVKDVPRYSLKDEGDDLGHLLGDFFFGLTNPQVISAMDRMFDVLKLAKYIFLQRRVGKQPLYEKNYEAKVKNICVRLERAKKKSMDKVKKIEERKEKRKSEGT